MRKISKGLVPGLAILAWGSSVKAKGAGLGTADTILDSIPVISLAKMIEELASGEDWLPDLGDERTFLGNTALEGRPVPPGWPPGPRGKGVGTHF